ncbi:MAG: 50S ribosomal protein L21, partial [Hyphomicrobiaceae bacterium]|nr:50S ribosomal protein L21 [Hyphomicrobiaceae bacterium]
AAKKAAPKKAEAEEAPKPAAAPAKAASATATEGVIDDLKLISGVGPALEKKLNALGITSLKQVAEFDAAETERVDAELNFKGRIEREDWIQQAKDLLAGKPPRAKSANK